jgi:hypothetical protein
VKFPKYIFHYTLHICTIYCGSNSIWHTSKMKNCSIGVALIKGSCAEDVLNPFVATRVDSCKAENDTTVGWVCRVVPGINMIKYLYCRIGPQFATRLSTLWEDQLWGLWYHWIQNILTSKIDQQSSIIETCWLPILALDHQIMALPSSSPNIHSSKIICVGLAYKARILCLDSL